MNTKKYYLKENIRLAVTYKVDKNLYDTVPKDNKKWDIRINKDGKAYVHYKRDFLPETTYPRVNAKKVWKWF